MLCALPPVRGLYGTFVGFPSRCSYFQTHHKPRSLRLAGSVSIRIGVHRLFHPLQGLLASITGFLHFGNSPIKGADITRQFISISGKEITAAFTVHGCTNRCARPPFAFNALCYRSPVTFKKSCQRLCIKRVFCAGQQIIADLTRPLPRGRMFTERSCCPAKSRRFFCPFRGCRHGTVFFVFVHPSALPSALSFRRSAGTLTL